MDFDDVLCWFWEPPLTPQNLSICSVDVDEVEYGLAPRDKRPRVLPNPRVVGISTGVVDDDTGAEADNEKSEYETEDQASLTGVNSQEELEVEQEPQDTKMDSSPVEASKTLAPPLASTPASGGGPITAGATKRKKMHVARPFGMMRGHTAFLTFASAGNKKHPNPNLTKT